MTVREYPQEWRGALGDWNLVHEYVTAGPHYDKGGAVFNVKHPDFGAVGDGVTDDTAAIQGAIDAADAVGGGIVYAPLGTYIIKLTQNPSATSYYSCFRVKSKVCLVGAGVELTIFKFADSQTDPGGTQSQLISTPVGTVATDVRFMDFTLDGNAANQSYLVAHGLFIAAVRNARVTRVRVKGVYGTASGPPGETTHFECNASVDVHYTDCEALGNPGGVALETATGFSANNATGVRYENCVARGMKHGMGFTHWTSALIQYVNCHAYLNGFAGFNSERSQHISYTNCHGGGKAALATTLILTSGQSLGNTLYGFRCQGSQYVSYGGGCHAQANGSHGFYVLQSTSPTTMNSDYISFDHSCLATDNVTYGVRVDTAQTHVAGAGRVIAVANGTDYSLLGGGIGNEERWGSNEAGSVINTLNAAAGAPRFFRFQSAGLDRWQLHADNATESGANAGSDLALFAYDDSGVFLFTPLKVLRASGVATFPRGVGLVDASATTPGSVVKKVQVYNTAGASIGYLAVYDAIT